jgi:sec-independent protein translocase protein TatA
MAFSGMLLNIAGSEWAIIILLALVLLFGTKRLPQLSRTLGRAMGEYEKAKQTFRNEMQEAAEEAKRDAGMSNLPHITGPVATEREKLATIAQSLGIDPEGKTEAELRALISQRMNV